MKFLLSLLLLMPMATQAAIGTVTDQTGTTVEIKRGKQIIASTKSTGIESMDSVNVGSRSETHITFNDNTRVKIKENSKLVIDDFVYDPKKSDAGRMAMKVTLGTVQYASGQIAKNNQQNMNIKTPTATIAVRGTDFAMTVDEVGRSLVVLLPSCRDPRDINQYEIEGNCTVGMIDVETAAGKVTLSTPFTATYVVDNQQIPLSPVKVDITAVGNDSNLKRPGAIQELFSDREEKKISERDRSRVTVEDSERTAKNTNEKSANARSDRETTLIGLNAVNNGQMGTPATNPCWPFNDCGNEKGRNWYQRIDDERGNTIVLKSGEKADNTTYAISINSNEVNTKIVGDGSNKVTVRIWNR
jgi:hypothetical protein